MKCRWCGAPKRLGCHATSFCSQECETYYYEMLGPSEAELERLADEYRMFQGG
jgi:hypothetical protein